MAESNFDGDFWTTNNMSAPDTADDNEDGVRRFTASEIEVPAIPFTELKETTDSFGTEALIGQGSNGKVYRATLRIGQAAIKKLDPVASEEDDVNFSVQLSLVSRLKNEYFLELLGYCLEDGNRILVYQFATLGSLHDILHGKEGILDAESGPVLSWNQRVKIAYGAARGLEYLHEKAQPSIVHGEVRSSNVLLFDDYDSKLGDFNLTDRYPDRADCPYSVQVSETLGYLAPEYAVTGTLSRKSDVYSFGVLLLELLSGRKPVDQTMPEEKQSLVAWAIPKINEENVDECVDPKLTDYPQKAVAKWAAVAALCLQDEADFRPNMSIIVKALQPLVDSIEPQVSFIPQSLYNLFRGKTL
ncbi:putative protein kinase [Platanthera zijinensis]|uniref:Protein kinase domain-containing protein n=1 Tax=Platanthera zijinensis TaxID=2320716 RepID=A0AAP0ASX8_9ASPA